MNYTKPEINSLGDAAELIQSLGKIGSNVDGVPPFADPAYDLDE
jgi:hypothetical protein